MTSDPLRIALDIGPLHGHRTGVGTAVQGIHDSLQERADVALDPYLVSFRAAPSDGQRKLPLPGIAASHLWSRTDRPSADRWLRNVDVVHGTNYVAPPSGLPTVVSVYDCWFLRHPDAANPLVRRAADNLRRRVASGAWIHTSSEATAAHARALLGTDRVVTVHLGPPPAATVNGSPSPEAAELSGVPFVLAIGTEERRKDLPTLVTAFAQLAATNPALRLVLAGAPGDQSEEVSGAIEALGHEAGERVHRLGPIDPATKAWLLRQTTVLAYPSLDEGFGFPILEAQAAGAPVVASDVGSVGEIAGPGAVLVTERSPDVLAEALGSVIDGSRSRLGLITAGHENLSRFSWSATAAGLVDLYRRAASA